MVLEHDLGAQHTRYAADRLVGVGDHEEGEVGRAEVRRQPEVDVGHAVRGHGARRDEPQRGDGFVELRIAHRAQRGQH